MGRVLDGGPVVSGWGGRRPGAGARVGRGRKLSDWEAEEMRSERGRGASVAALAERYGVCERTARRYLYEYGRERS